MKRTALELRSVGFLVAFGLAQAAAAAPWVETASFFNSGGASSNYFGHSVAIDGDVAVVGQLFTGTETSGVAFVFVRSGGSWIQAATLVPDESTPNDFFGNSVAIS